jgi:hypothetical protein
MGPGLGRHCTGPGKGPGHRFVSGLFYDVLQYLPDGKGAGPDGIPNDIIQRMPREFHDLLFTIMKKAWEGHHTPEGWKGSTVALLHKKGDPPKLKNWRPIALTNCTYKLWTAVITRLVTDGAEYRNGQPMMVSVRTVCGETETFPVRRGTIQGDTLIPLLFMVFLDPLVHWLNSGEEGLRTATSGVRISAPAFTDDMALLIGGIPALSRQLCKVELYAAWGGLSLNVPKCGVGGINVKGLGEGTYTDLRI